MEIKRWRQLARPGARHHLATVVFTPGRPARLHTHDFPEVFWIEEGAGRHCINGQNKRLDTGDLVFVRPSDRHWLEAADPSGFALVNLAYDPGLWRSLMRRHPRQLRPVFNPANPLPYRARLSPAAMASLRRQLEELSRPDLTPVALEYFLLGLYQRTLPAAPGRFPAMPDWLRQACLQVQRPEIFAAGAAGFVRAAGRSAEHVARTMHRTTGRTPSAYVNAVRMDYAARELRVTSRPITEIALDCGLGNLSHFYALFRRAHGHTPGGYRQAHHRSVA